MANDYLIENQSVTGKIVRPAPDELPEEVVLTAKIQRGDGAEPAIETKPFNITIRPWTHLEVVEYEAQVLTHAALYLPLNNHESAITNNLNLKSEGFMGCTITWSSTADSLINTDSQNGLLGTVTRPTYSQGDQVVVLTAIIASGDETNRQAKSCEYKFTVKANAQTPAEAANAYLNNPAKFVPGNWTTGSEVGQDPTAPGFAGITNNLVLPQIDGLYNILWESGDPASLEIITTGARPILKPVTNTVALKAKVRYGTYTTENENIYQIRIASSVS
jgi:hypothetical protein